MTRIAVLGPGDETILRSVAQGVFDGPIREGLAREYLEDPRHHLVVATDADEVVGMASAIHYVHPDKDPELWINEIGVAPGHRGRGLGKRLLRELLRIAHDLGCREAWVLTERDNAAAMRLYESTGGRAARSGTVMFSFDPHVARGAPGADPSQAGGRE